MGKLTTREKIINTAEQLFYEQGFETTSFADIAERVEISRGNFYHHFKSKDDILNAVIELRLNNARDMICQWETQSDSPKDRIKCYINIVIENKNKIKRFGCPLGSLCLELNKLQHLSRSGATRVFEVFRVWLREQFEQMGLQEESDFKALHVLAWSQGVATLANAYRDDHYIMQEVKQMEQWLDSHQ